MLNKKLMVLAIFFMTLVAVSAVSAAEDAGDVAPIESDAQINDISTDEMQGDALKASDNDESEDALDASDDGEILTGMSDCYVNCSYVGEQYGTCENPYRTLEAALNEEGRDDGDIIHIAAGTYAGDENVGLTINKKLTLTSWGPGEVIFDGQNKRGIFAIETDEFNVDGITFKNCRSDMGGALYFANGLRNSRIGGAFINNTAAMCGGAIYVHGDVDNSLIPAYFHNNTVICDVGSADEHLYGSGGAICIDGKIVSTLIDGDFINNNASMSGGAIFVINGFTDTNVSGCEFKFNDALIGGAIYAPFMNYCNIKGDFVNNTALVGGAIYTNVVKNTNIDSNFANNAVNSSLASKYPQIMNGIYNYLNKYIPQTVGFIQDVTAKYNINPGFGGAISILGMMENSNIDGEFVNNFGADAGGAVCVLGTVNKSEISGRFWINRAELGGSLFLPVVNYSNISGEFLNNFAVQGGAIFADMVNNTNIKGDYLYNVATAKSQSNGGLLAWGGAICIDGTLENSNIDSLFMYNNADELGGAIGGIDFVINSNITGSFINNTAKMGGAINAPYIDHSTVSGDFINNTADVGGAIFTCYLNNTEISAHFANNAAKRTEDIRINEFDKVSFALEPSDFSSSGGALCVLGIMENTVFTGDFADNHAVEGGAIFVESCELRIGEQHFDIMPMENNAFNSKFIGNVALKGAAIFIDPPSSNNKFNSNFINNYAFEEGIIYFNNESSGDSIFNCLFLNNTALISVIHIENAYRTNITNNIFLNPLRDYDIRHIGGSDSKLNVDDNWFGHNATNYKELPMITGTVECNTWLFLTASANPNPVSYKGSSSIVFNMFVYNNATGKSGKFDSSLLEPVTLEIASTDGKVDKNAVSFGDVIKFSSNGKNGTVTALVGNAFDTVVINSLPLITANKLTAGAKAFKFEDKTKKYAVTLKNSKGNAIKNTKITLKVNGVTYTATTNDNGVAIFALTKLTKSGNAVITYPGDSSNKKATKKVKLTVKAPVFKTVSYGSKDKAMVKKIQRALKNNGFYIKENGHHLKVDGIFHKYTVKAVKQFQKANKLKVTGSVDYKTAKKLKII